MNSILIVLTSRQLYHKEKVIIDNVKKKKIKLVVSKTTNVKYADYLQIYSDTELPSKIKYVKYMSIIQVIKYILCSYSETKKRFEFMSDLFSGLDCIIFSSGPTSLDYDKEQIKHLKKHHIIMSVKYIFEKLVNDDIVPDIAFFSDCSHDPNFTLNKVVENYEFNSTITGGMHKHVKSKNIMDLNYTMVKGIGHKATYQNVKKYDDFNIFRYNPDKIVNNKLSVNLAHIMMELSVPFCVYTKIKTIYTYGWDGPNKNGVYDNLNGTSINFEREKKIGSKKSLGCTYNEYCFTEHILNALQKIGIKIYKCSEKSSMNIPIINLKTI